MFFFISGFLAYKTSRIWNARTLGELTMKKLRVQIIPTAVFFLLFLAMIPTTPFIDSLNEALASSMKAGYWFTLVLLYMLLTFYLFSYVESKIFRGYEGTGARGLENSLEAESNLVPPHLLTTVPPTFSIDWDDFEAKCSDEKTTVFLLCNPHNPTGRVWTKEELERMNDICLKHNVKVVSDEIHCELMMPGHTFQPFAAVSEACRKNSVILNSPSKSFNIAGLQIANIIVSNPSWRRRIDRAININEVCDVNPFGPVALIAAYNESEDWIDELNQYLWENYTVLCDFIDKNLPQWKVCPLEGTYLPWVDVSAMGIPVDELCDRLLREAKVWINPGTMYGPESGKGYVRFNIATQRSRLLEALERIKVSFSPPE